MAEHDRIGPPDKSGEATESFGDGAGGGTTLTTSWVTGAAVDVKRRSGATIRVKYVKGSETTGRVRVMVAKGATAPALDSVLWTVAGELGTASSGVRALQKGEVTLTPADFDATDYVVFDVSCRGADWLKTDAKYVGGSSPGSVYTEVWGAWGL